MPISNFFRLTEDHLKLLRHAVIGWDSTEYGAPGIDQKRPFGNSDATRDIARILGWHVPMKDEEVHYNSGEYQALERRCRRIHEELQHAMQIVLLHAGEHVSVGLYERSGDYRSWRLTEIERHE